MISRRQWRRSALVPALIGVIGVFYLTTIRPGHDWGGDFSAYIQHAKNIVDGQPYRETSFVYTFDGLSPRAYPPVFPLLLAPTYALRGVDLVVMKAVVVLFFLLALVVLDRGFARGMKRTHRAVLIAVLGFSPAVCYLKDHILPTFPFLFFVYASLSLLRHRAGHEPESWSIARSILAGVAVYLAFATRTVGLVLIPALLTKDLLAERRVSRSSLTTIAVFTALASAQALWIGLDPGYLEQWRMSLETTLKNLHHYAVTACLFFDNGAAQRLCAPLLAAVAGLASIGYASRAVQRISISETFFPLYLATLVSWPHPQGFRFLLPLFPLFLLYALHGFQALTRSSWRRGWNFGGALLLALILLSYIGQYSKLGFGPQSRGVESPEAEELFSYVRETTGHSELLLFRKPRVMALFTGRRTAEYPRPFDPETLLDQAEDLQATHVIVGVLDGRALRSFAADSSNRFQLVFENRDFLVYRFPAGGKARSG